MRNMFGSNLDEIGLWKFLYYLPNFSVFFFQNATHWKDYNALLALLCQNKLSMYF